MITIALDAMGGDHGVTTTVAAACQLLKETSLKGSPKVKLILVGQQDAITDALRQQKMTVGERLSIQHASEVVAMDESPALALRGKKDSSMRVAINLVKEGQANACVSAGNTGALMATARYVLKTLPGIKRPAICTTLPTVDTHTHMLDLGANVDTSAEHLFQFAVMGSVLVAAVDDIQSPTIGLLNIGAEEIKGNEQVKQAAKLLENSHLNYYGFIEGDDIYQGKVNVVVCDGFAGNVALKSSEGVARMISHHLKKCFNKNFMTRLAALFASSVLKQFRDRMDPRRYNGASLLGLRGIVIKSHGGADAFAFKHAIHEAMIEVEKNMPEKLAAKLATELVSVSLEQRTG
ncbi:phosphate acyltransferase PlsX [Gammaproteobacteria bacterium AH-315-M22]|nr:phosphate acyltransferase PlsX [Gammaproteobacteria bacterium AH-315-M22]